MKNYKSPKNTTLKNIKFFFKKNNLELLNEEYLNNKKNETFTRAPYKPELKDLYRLYKYVTLNKRVTIVEFGSGWSSLVLIMALNENKLNFAKDVKKLRKNNPFEIFILENNKNYLNLSKKRVRKFFQVNKIKNNIKIHWIYTDAYMSTYNDHICTKYKKLPLCNPDFIYSDGPGQFGVKESVNNFSTNHKDIVPIGADLLMIEYFLVPGTIIIIDGRAANANFLKDNFKRKWKYKRDYVNDQHVFFLKDQSFGNLNDKILDFYKK